MTDNCALYSSNFSFRILSKGSFSFFSILSHIDKIFLLITLSLFYKLSKDNFSLQISAFL